jgi:DNA-binding winged helix-turn-helix (wHTH) protein/tetratricopeptide (TPR) repeat protein/type II secretory pathway predicted ATPase ExeA
VSADDPLLLCFHPFELDERQARLTRAGAPVALAPRAFEVLCALARAPGQLVRKDELLDAVWGHRHVSESVLKTIVSELRAALGDDARQPRFIETASRRGYRFIAALQPHAGASSAHPAAPAPAAPTPPVSSNPSSPPLIGRVNAGAQLDAAWRTAATGRRQMLWLTGEAGIGKTTLIEHFVTALDGQATIAHGQCVEQHGAGEPYLPILEALASLCRQEPALVALLRSVAPTWLLQLPWLTTHDEREALRLQLTGIGQERMLREFGEWLDRATQARALVLVTEDLHWSDHATLRLLDHVARRRSPARLLWLASFRLAEVIAADHPLKALRHELRLHRLVSEIALDPFSEREVADYVARRLDAPAISETLARALHERTDGLPLFVASVVDDWAAQGVRATDASAAAALPGAPVPESLAGVIDKQIERLPAPDRELLEAASVCGVEFGSVTLADVMGADAAAIGARCDELSRRQHWLSARAIDPQRDGTLGARFAFRHALYRQVFYQRIGALARAQLHRNVAESMGRHRGSTVDGSAAELAMHYELSHDVPAALRHYALAAESALQHFAPLEAMSLTQHALELLPSCPEGRLRLELEMALLGPRSVAVSQVEGVTAPATTVAFERLEQLCELLPEKATRALEMGYGWSLFVRGEYDGALQRARRKLALAEARGDKVLHVAACNLSGATLTYQGELFEARRWLEQGVAATAGLGEALASALTVVDLEASLRSRLAMLLAVLGEVEAALQQIALAHARVATVRQPYSRRLVLIFEGFLHVRLGQPERVRELAEQMERIAADHSIAQADGPVRWLAGWACARLGDPVGGHALILEGFAIDNRIGVMRGRSGVLGYSAEALILARRWAEAQAQVDEAMVFAERLGERLHRPDLLLLTARIAVGRRDATAARAAMQAALAEARAQGARWNELVALVALCELAQAPRDEFDALAAVRARIIGGHDTALVQRADELLLAHSSRRSASDQKPTDR